MDMRKNNKKLIIIDLDGTLFYNFLEVDRNIIKELFDLSKMVLFIDNVARLVNSSGIIKNTMFALKFRLFVYSLFSKKKYKQVLKEYRKRYAYEACECVKKQKNSIDTLNKLGYEVLILSNNRYSSPLKAKCNIVVARSKYRKLRQLKKEYKDDLSYVIGDNFFDDIFPARMLGIKNIYIREYKLMKKRYLKGSVKNKNRKNFYYNNLSDVLNDIFIYFENTKK